MFYLQETIVPWVYLYSLCNVLHPLQLFPLGRSCNHESPFAIVDIEAEVSPHPWLTVDHLQVGHGELPVHAELQPRGGGPVGVQQQVGELREVSCYYSLTSLTTQHYLRLETNQHRILNEENYYNETLRDLFK